MVYLIVFLYFINMAAKRAISPPILDPAIPVHSLKGIVRYLLSIYGLISFTIHANVASPKGLNCLNGLRIAG